MREEQIKLETFLILSSGGIELVLITKRQTL